MLTHFRALVGRWTALDTFCEMVYFRAEPYPPAEQMGEPTMPTATMGGRMLVVAY